MTNLGRQFNVYRGVSEDVPLSYIRQAGAENNRTGGVGMHWTTNKSVAKKFARPDETQQSVMGEGTAGTILHGTIAKEHTYEPYSEEWNRIAYPLGIAGRDDWEREVTAKPGAQINLTGVTHLRQRGPRGGLKARKINYKKPKQVKA